MPAMPLLPTRLLRHLRLDTPQPGEQRPWSAASGLVRIGERLHVIADDELGLALFPLAGDSPGTVVPLFPGALPGTPAARKAAKPDWEALCLLPAFGGDGDHGALLAFGSGSAPGRHRAALLPLDGAGEPRLPARELDIGPLLAPLHRRFAQLNIEGAFVVAGALCLLQRGNGREPLNACIRFDWPQVAAWLRGQAGAPAPVRVDGFELGRLDGVPLSFTDGAALPDGGWAFSAAAEDTTDPYADGACRGSALGRVDAQGRLRGLWRLDRVCKVEGLSAGVDEGRLGLLMVTDADDRAEAALLLSATLDWPPA